MGLDKQQLKEMLGERAKDIIIAGLGVVGYNDRTKNALCPVHNEKTPSFHWNDKTYCFKCFGCGITIDIYEYYTKFEGKTFIESKKIIADMLNISVETDYNKIHKIKQDTIDYLKPKSQSKELSQTFIEYFNSRGIEKETLDFFRVKQTVVNFARKDEPENKKQAIVFPHYDEYNVLVHECYRSINKDIKQSYKTKSIPYGMWFCNPSERIIFVEGQIDAMTLWQCGFKNVLSVPGGASNFKFIENSYDFLSESEELILWADNDESGMKLAAVMKSKYNNLKVIHHNKYKDANDLYKNEGAESVRTFLNIEPDLPQCVKKMNDMHYSTEVTGEEERVETGFKDLDKYVDDWRMGQLSIIFSRDGEGKSTWVSQMIVHQILSKRKVFLYSAELGDQGLQDWLFRQLIGNEPSCFIKKQDKYKEKFFIKPDVVSAIKQWGNDFLYVMDRKNTDIEKDEDELFKTMKLLSRKFGVKLFILDNLQSILTENATTLYSDQSQFVEKCRKFAHNEHVLVVIVAHTRKAKELEILEDKQGNLLEPTTGSLDKDDISGSKNISNKAHNVLSVERNFTGEFFDAIVTNLKDKNEGDKRSFKYNFDKTTFRFYNSEVVQELEKHWKQFLKPEPTTVNYYNGESQTFEQGELLPF
jgi:twinkle protein